VCADELKVKGGATLVGSKVAKLETGVRSAERAELGVEILAGAHRLEQAKAGQNEHVGLKEAETATLVDIQPNS
jgi:hypothetical protein